MRVRVLGDVEVLLGDVPVDLGGPKPRALLGLLVAAEGRPVPVEQLVDEIWGEDPPARVEASLQSYVARLRRELEPARVARGAPSRLRTHPGAYSLVTDEVDAARLGSLAERGRAPAAADPAAAEALLVEALSLWRGEPYSGLGWCPSLAAEATRLREVHRSVEEDLWQLRLHRGDHASVAAELGRAVRLEPLRERRWALLALAQYRGSRQGDALATLRRAREVLADELGVDPGEDLRRLEAAVLRQDPALDAPPHLTPAGAPAVSPPPTPSTAVAAAATAGPASSVPAGKVGTAPLLVGRDEALAAVEAAMAEAATGSGRVVLVRGEAGIGKTRLASAAVAAAARRRFRTGRGAWEPDGSPPLWGWSRASREALGRDVLRAAPDEVLDAASESFRLAESLLTALRDAGPTLLLLDDLHWADVDSVRLVRRVAAQLHDVPTVLVLALRGSGPETSSAVSELLAALARLDPVRVELGGLDSAAVEEYVHRHAGVRLARGAADELVLRTGGNPLYVTEVVRLLGAEGALARPGSEAWRRVPPGVLDVVRQRLAQLDDPAPQLLTAAAVVGRSFDVAVVAAAAGSPVEIVEEAVESGLALGLLEGLGPTTFQFTHALVGDALREGLPVTARTRLHAAVAVALEEHHAGRVAAHAAELAEHYRLAGPEHARSAWVLARRAAEAAAEGSAHAEALRWYRVADELQREPGLVTAAESEAVLVGLGRALRRLSRPVESWDPLARAARSALDRGEPARSAEALLEVTEDAVWGWRVRPAVDRAAINLWEEVLAAADPDGTDPLPPPARALAEAALANEHLYDPAGLERSTALVDTALARVRRSGTPAELAAVLQVACLALSRAGSWHRRAAVTDELVEVTSREGDGPGLALALTKRASGRGELGRWQDAHSDLVRASQLARRHHHTPVLLIAGWGLAVVLASRGETARAREEVVVLQQLEESLGMPGVGVSLAQQAGLLLMQGRLGELEPVLRRGAEHSPDNLRDLHALALATSGRREEARLLLGPWAEQPPLVPDYLWLTFTVLRAWLWLELDDPAAVDRLRADLEPHADLAASGGMSSFFLGSVAHTLGRLALHQGDLEGARRHLLAARQAHERMGLPGWVERTDALLAGCPAS